MDAVDERGTSMNKASADASGAASDAESIAAWGEALARGRAALEGVTRRRVKGATRDVELAVLDWGGHGDSTSIPPGADTDSYAWRTLALDVGNAIGALLSLTGHERVGLAIGHSFGGALLLRAAAEHPARFERLLLCDPVIVPPMTPEQRRARSHTVGLAASTRKRRDRFPSRAAAFEHCRTRGLFADFAPEVLALYVDEGMRDTPEGERALKCDREVEAAIFDAGGASVLIEAVDRVTAEVLFVHAQRANFSREYYEEVASRIPRARVESLDVGHLFPLEEPERVLKLVDEWLSNA